MPETLKPGPVQALAALFDDGVPAPRSGDPLPPLWHWVALPSWSPFGDAGPDGHPMHAVPAPPSGYPRRMFAGGRVQLVGPLVVGEPVERDVRVVSSQPKTGRQGDLVVVEVGTRLTNANGRLAVVETQDIIYRRQSSGGPAAEPLPQPSPAGQLLQRADGGTQRADGGAQRADGGTWRMRTDPVILARFSAATANAHRIHYDWPYATGVEGYPGLVVHGPLMTLTMLETIRRETPDRTLTLVRHRNHRPLFCGQEAVIEASDETLTLSTAAGVHATVEVS